MTGKTDIRIFIGTGGRNDLPDEAVHWLMERCWHSIECLRALQAVAPGRVGGLRIDSCIFASPADFLQFDADDPGEYIDALCSSMPSNEPFILVDVAAAFLCGEDIIRLYAIAKNSGSAIMLSDGIPVATCAFRRDFRSMNMRPQLIDMPAFRALYVKGLYEFILAQSIDARWPLFFFNTAYKDYWQGLLHKKNYELNMDSLERDIVSNRQDFLCEREKIYLFFLESALSFKKTVSMDMLDAGCGDGDLFPLFGRKGLNINGVDISWGMVQDARINSCGVIRQGLLENTGFEKESFGFINVWGVFDSSDQDKALHHMLSLLIEGGILLITGKNDNYSEADVAAYEAELGARTRLFPNGYTSVGALEAAIVAYGGKIVAAFYGKMRGDLANGIIVRDKPTKFYEWVIIVRKERPTPFYPLGLPLSSPVSRRLSCMVTKAYWV